MIEIIIVGVTLGLILIASGLYKGGQRRVRLLRIGCIALFVAMFCRGIDPPYDGPLVDLVKRLAILAAQVSIALLVLTFRSRPLPRWATPLTYLVAGLIAAGESWLVWSIPQHPNGNIFAREEIAEARGMDGAWALITYHLLYLSAFTATTAVVAVGCWSAMTRKGQPLSARFPVACIFAGAAGAGLFIASSIMDLFDRPVLGGTESRTVIIVAVVSLFLIGLVTGIIRGVTISLRDKVALHVAREIVVPLWRTTTMLHPDVKLPAEEQREFDQVMTLSRLTIETHDALRLIREDDDPALKPLHQAHPKDPELSAGLLRHLGGEHAVPPLGWFTIALTRLRSLRIDNDAALVKSLSSLYEIRLAMGEMHSESR